MDITTETAARAWLTSWQGRSRPGILNATMQGLETRLAIEAAAPHRYAASAVDTRAALTYLHAATASTR